jgi:hypothetical protein
MSLSAKDTEKCIKHTKKKKLTIRSCHFGTRIFISRLFFFFYYFLFLPLTDIHPLSSMAADFTAGPLYSLLSSVDHEQRVLYISQLKVQYDKCDSESERFGILKLLLPTVTAVEDKSVVEETLKPIVLESFQVDSMVSTESIALIVSTLAERIASALDKDETDFSIDLLQLLLCELVTAMQTEVDLVELNPVSFIDSQLGGIAEWKTIKAQATRDSLPDQLDLECCLDTLNQVLHYVQSDNVWIDVIGLVAVSLISSTDATLRTKAVNDVISSLYYRQESASRKTNICQVFSSFVSSND